MKVSYNWLKNYLDSEVDSNQLLEALPLLGFDVEETEVKGPPTMEHVCVGQVLSYEQHPNADRLRLCKVTTDTKETIHSIICGATNFKEGDKVMVALPGAILPGNFKIKKSKLRGVESEGMLCSAKELNIGQDHEGIMILDASIELGTPINAVFKDTDIIFDLEITPNRVDVLSHIGLARELAARFSVKVKLPEVSPLTNKEQFQPNVLLESLELESSNLCPEYSVVCMDKVSVSQSPDWLVEKIEMIGLRSVNNIVDVTNFVLHETGQPLHAFDADKIKGKSLRIRTAEAGEKITTLDGKDRDLVEGMLVISDAEKPLVIAGVMGSESAEVDLNTKSIVLESAYFNAGSIRKTARRLGLSTDSSYRFERGVDPLGLAYAIERATQLILEVAGGERISDRMTLGSVNYTDRSIAFSPSKMCTFIGFDVGNEAIISAFTALGLHLEDVDSSIWKVTVPSYRGDLSRAVDLYEEFIRIYGTDRIPPTEDHVRGVNTQDHPIYSFNDSVANYLCGRGFNEAFSYTLRDVKEFHYFFGEAHADTQSLSLSNPLQSDQSHLRTSLLPGLLDVLTLNHARQNFENQFFERGRVFKNYDGQLIELISVGFVAFSKNLNRTWLERAPFDFYKAKKLVEDLVDLIPVKVATGALEPILENQFWQAGHSAHFGSIKKEKYEISVGLLNVKSLKERWDLSEPVLAGSLLVHPELFERKHKSSKYEALSNQPASHKDLSLIVDAHVLSQEVQLSIERFAKKVTEGFQCESVQVFDVYQGKGLESDKKSFAVSMTFRAKDRTLKDSEVNKAFEKIQEKVSSETAYLIRK